MRQLINTTEKVVAKLGYRGEPSEVEVLEFIRKNDFDDDFIADIYSYYLIDGESINDLQLKK